MFKTYIRPKIEYNAPIWSPYLKKDVIQLEKIQRHFTKKAFERCNLPNVDYNERLRMLNLLSLENRRIYLDQVFLFNLIHNNYDLAFETFFTLKQSKYSLRSHSSQIMIKNEFRTSHWQNSFFVRAPTTWNKLPQNIINAGSLAMFKNLLKLKLLSSQWCLLLFCSIRVFLPLCRRSSIEDVVHTEYCKSCSLLCCFRCFLVCVFCVSAKVDYLGHAKQ